MLLKQLRRTRGGDIFKCVDTTNLRHQTFGHLGTKAIVVMSKKEVVLGIPTLEENKCESSLCSCCVSGEFDSKSFRSSGVHWSKRCERIHMDIKGPVKVVGIGKFQELSHSGFTKAFLLVNRSEALKFYQFFESMRGTLQTKGYISDLTMSRSSRKTWATRVWFCMKFLTNFFS
jgi:hypothetical protein